VKHVEQDSIASELGLEPGDRIVEINGRPLLDCLEFQFVCEEENLTLLVERGNDRALFEVEKDSEDPLGLSFTEELFDGIRRCSNQCVFCFVHQNPSGLRRSLYVKDEDFRLSFLHGNYITLTNLSEDDFERIIRQRMSPLYISVHVTEPEARQLLLGRRKTASLLPLLDRLADHSIDFYSQIVLCPGLNDGSVLSRTLADLESYHPRLRGISVVPVGLTCHRKHLYPLRGYDRPAARELVETVQATQQRFLKGLGTRFVFLADEFYLLAGYPFPPAATYEGFDMREDGVGMIPLFLRDFRKALKRFSRKAPIDRKVVIVTGRGAESMFRETVIPEMVRAGWPRPGLLPVTNRFFGSAVDVSGLLTGQDLSEALSKAPKAEFALVCDYSLKSGTDLFLDDVSVRDLEERFSRPVVPVADSPSALLRVIRDGPALLRAGTSR